MEISMQLISDIDIDDVTEDVCSSDTSSVRDCIGIKTASEICSTAEKAIDVLSG